MKIFLITFLVFVSFSCRHHLEKNPSQLRSLAGNGSERGGGDALYCKGGLFGKKYYLADTYKIFNSENRKIFNLLETQIPKRYKRDFIFELLSLGVDKDKEKFFKDVRSISEKFKIIQEDDIEDIDDDNIDLPADCSKKEQLAVHEIGTFKIRVKKSIYSQLSETEKEFLLVHEVFIYAYYTWGYNIFDPSDQAQSQIEIKKFDTSKIRSYLEKLASGPQFTSWINLFRTFVSLPGLRLHDLLVKVKFTDFEKVKDLKEYTTEEREALMSFAKAIQFQIITAKEIWHVPEKQVRNFADGWSQTYAAILNNEKNQNLGIVEMTCWTPFDDFNSQMRIGSGSSLLDRERSPVEYGHCYFNMLL